MNMKSCIYEGHVQHRRFSPVRNTFRYHLFMMYLDLEELPSLFKKRWLWSYEKPNIASFRRKDHHGSHDIPLEQAIRDLVRERLGYSPEGSIRILTHLRYFGYCFNPVSFYYCFDKFDREVQVFIAEIHNTPWGEEHCYVLDKESNMSNTDELSRFRFSKEFHISPFMNMDIIYDWQFTEPGKVLSVHMTNTEKEKKIFNATLELRQRKITGPALTYALIAYPFMTSKVITLIYWQALRLKLKGVPFYDHPSIKNSEKNKNKS